MRNIIEYPVTTDEVITVLSSIRDDILAEQTIGDLRAYIVELVIRNIKNNQLILNIENIKNA